MRWKTYSRQIVTNKQFVILPNATNDKVMKSSLHLKLLNLETLNPYVMRQIMILIASYNYTDIFSYCYKVSEFFSIDF